MPFENVKDQLRTALGRIEGVCYAVADSCSHHDWSFAGGIVEQYQLECPKHGARFDLRTGQALRLPAVRPVPTFEVELRDQEVWVCLPAAVSQT